MNAMSDPTSFLEKLFLSTNPRRQSSGVDFLGNKMGPGTGFNIGGTQPKQTFGSFFGQNTTTTTSFGQPQQSFGQQQQQGFGAFANNAPAASAPMQGANTQQIMGLIGEMIKMQVPASSTSQAARPSIASVASEVSTLDTSLSKILTAAPLTSVSMRLSTATKKPGVSFEAFRLLDDRAQNRFGIGSVSNSGAASASRAVAVGLLPQNATQLSRADFRKFTPITNPTALHIDETTMPTYRIPDSQPPDEQEPLPDANLEAHRPIITRPDYRTIPPISELQAMTLDQLREVKDFRIISEGNGVICWPGETDLTDVDIDRTVELGYRSATVYPDTLPYKDRHRRGEKLNKEAVITLHNVFPVNKGERVYDLPSVEKFSLIIKNATLKREARLISYNPNDGIWKFEVDFFI